MPRSPILTSALIVASIGMAAMAQDITLPERQGPRPETTNGVPHTQIGVVPTPELSEELLRRVDAFPGVILGATRVSLPGAVGFRLGDNVTLEHPEVIVGGREFAHLHPDGSLHASLAPETAEAAITAGWAVSHPWATQRVGWEGFVMIYTPHSEQELEVVYDLVKASYTFVTGNQIP